MDFYWALLKCSEENKATALDSLARLYAGVPDMELISWRFPNAVSISSNVQYDFAAECKECKELSQGKIVFPTKKEVINFTCWDCYTTMMDDEGGRAPYSSENYWKDAYADEYRSAMEYEAEARADEMADRQREMQALKRHDESN